MRDDERESGSIGRRRFLGATLSSAAALKLGLVGCNGDDAPAGTPTTDTTSGDTAQDAGADTAVPEADIGPDPSAIDGGQEVAADPEAVALDEATYPQSVVAGSMTLSGAIVCVQIAPPGSEKTLWVWRESASPGTVVLVTERAVSDADGFVREPLSGLAPGQEYHYAFFDGSVDPGFTGRSNIGRFRTPKPEGDRSVVTIAATACTKTTYAPFDALVVAAEHDFDMFCHLGDMAYNDKADTLPEYRENWDKTLGDPGYRAVFANGGIYATWDDHEIADSATLYDLPPQQLEAGLTAYFERLPIEREGQSTIWRSYRWGSSVEVFVLDCRLERQPETMETDNPIYISPEQMTWLKQALTDSPCHFKVLLNSVPITTFPTDWGFEDDRWDGYKQQKDELLGHILDTGIDNVWFLSGDYHFGSVMRVEPEGPRSQIFEILCGPGGSSPNPLAGAVELQPSLAEQFFPEKQFLYYRLNHAATLLTFDPEAESVRVLFVDGETRETLFDQTLSAG